MAVFVAFDASCSTGNIGDYVWDFGDGTTGTGATLSHTYTDTGPWVVTLTVTNAVGPPNPSVATALVTQSGNVVVPGAVSVTVFDAAPQVMLRISNDAGRTWVTEQWRSAGKPGEWLKRVRWNGLGSARRRVFEVVTTDPVPWRFISAELEVSQGGPAVGAR